MKLYKHILNTDVAVTFLHKYQTSAGYKCKVAWFNIVNPNNIYMIERDKIFINNSQINNWREYVLSVQSSKE